MNDGKLYVATGSSRSGKSAWMREKIREEAYEYLLVWDPKHEYGEKDDPNIPRSQKALVTQLHAWSASDHKPCAIIYRYTSLKDDFDYFCQVAMYWIQRLNALGKRGAVIIEETADTTSPGKAPEAYGMLCRRGLCEGSDIYATTQRIAESDKTAIGNATEIHCCAQSLDDDAARMAKYLKVPVDQVSALVRDEDAKRWEYFHRDVHKGVTVKGAMTIGKDGKPEFSTEK